MQKNRQLLSLPFLLRNDGVIRTDSSLAIEPIQQTITAVQGGPKKPDCFWCRITLQWRMIERHVKCQKSQNFV